MKHLTDKSVRWSLSVACTVFAMNTVVLATN